MTASVATDGTSSTTLLSNTLASGSTPTDAAPFATTRPSKTTRSTRHSARSHHPGRDHRTDILDAASSLVADGGFSAATTRNIAELTGLASGAVAAEFGTREDLLAAVYQRLAATELAAVDHASRTHGSTAVERLTALVGTFATRALHGRHAAEALLYEPVAARVNQERLTYRRQYHALVVGILADGVASGELPAQNPATSARAVTGAVVESLLGRLSPTVPVAGDGHAGEDATPLIDEVTELVLRLVGARC